MRERDGKNAYSVVQENTEAVRICKPHLVLAKNARVVNTVLVVDRNGVKSVKRGGTTLTTDKNAMFVLRELIWMNMVVGPAVANRVVKENTMTKQNNQDVRTVTRDTTIHKQSKRQGVVAKSVPKANMETNFSRQVASGARVAGTNLRKVNSVV